MVSDIASLYPDDEYYVSRREAESIAVSLLSEKDIIPDTKVMYFTHRISPVDYWTEE